VAWIERDTNTSNIHVANLVDGSRHMVTVAPANGQRLWWL
jgi:hypothetical protein